MAQLVNVELSKSSNAVVVTVVGEVDRDTADVLAEGVERALLLVPEPRAVVADLSGVRLLAAAGATVLASANATCGSRGVPMLVVAPNRAVRRTLELCGLLSELHVVAEFPMATAAGLARELEDRAVMGTAVGVAMADQRRARAVLAAHARKADVTVRERTREVVPRSPGTVGKRGAGQTEEPSRLLIDLVAAAWETEPREHQDHITDLAAALKRQGHQVALHVRRTSHEPPASERTASGFDVVRVPAGPPTVLSRAALLPHLDEFATALGRTWAGRAPDVVHLHSWQSGLAVREPEAPVTQSLHGLESTKDSAGSSKVAELELMTSMAADRVLAASSDEVLRLTRLGVPRARMARVPWGVDTTLFSPNGPAAPRGAAPRVLALGEVAPHSGFDTVVQALLAVPDAELVVVGPIRSAVPREDPELTRLVQLARKHDVAHRLRFTGELDRTALAALLRSADVAVCVPWREPSGIRALQAMACGVPVIASTVGALTDIVINDLTGVLVPPRDPAALGQALHDLLADPLRREVCAITGADRARNRFSWERVAAEVVRAYPVRTSTPAQRHHREAVLTATPPS